MSLQILGMATAVPPHTMSQQQAAGLAEQVGCDSADQARLLRVLYRKAGVDNRHTCLPFETAIEWSRRGEIADESAKASAVAASAIGLGPTTAERMAIYQELAPPLARRAARQALTNSAVAAHDITHLITVSCTGFAAPGIDANLIQQLGLPATTERTHIGFMGCHGAINGLRVARAIGAADPTARILLCAVELCSLHYRLRWDPERFIGNSLFADGAAALVCGQASADAADSTNREHRETGPWQLAASGSCMLPDSSDAMTWRIGDHGFEMTLSPRVPELIRANLRPWLESWLAGQGVSLGDVGSWAVHPGGPRILSAVEECLSLERAATSVSREVFSEFGNMSSPTVLFILERLRQRAAPRACVMLGFGPGLVAEVALLR